MEDNTKVSDLGYPALPWLPDYVKYVLLDGGESILPYICDKKYVEEGKIKRNE